MLIFKSFLYKTLVLALVISFISNSLYTPAALAGQIFVPSMPAPGMMVGLSPAYTPAFLKGIIIHPENPLRFDFLIDQGDGRLTASQKKQEYERLVKYFLASLTVPDKDQWVNLSPYEKGRIIEGNFGRTEMGRDLLSQDYLLKQITSSLMYPESGSGKSFWQKVYSKAWSEYHTTDIPVNTFNKVWIVPDHAVIDESGNTAYVVENHLKVMLEEDYLSLEKHAAIVDHSHSLPILSSKVIREIILPQLEKEVNEGGNFALLRQIASGMLLAAWYKKALKESLLGQIYADKAKVKGIDQDPKANQAIYQMYLSAFKKGVYNYIKEDYDRYTQQTIPRKYFAGGWSDTYGQAQVTSYQKLDRSQLIAAWEKDKFPQNGDVAKVVLGKIEAHENRKSIWSIQRTSRASRDRAMTIGQAQKNVFDQLMNAILLYNQKKMGLSKEEAVVKQKVVPLSSVFAARRRINQLRPKIEYLRKLDLGLQALVYDREWGRDNDFLRRHIQRLLESGSEADRQKAEALETVLDVNRHNADDLIQNLSNKKVAPLMMQRFVPFLRAIADGRIIPFKVLNGLRADIRQELTWSKIRLENAKNIMKAQVNTIDQSKGLLKRLESQQPSYPMDSIWLKERTKKEEQNMAEARQRLETARSSRQYLGSEISLLEQSLQVFNHAGAFEVVKDRWGRKAGTGTTADNAMRSGDIKGPDVPVANNALGYTTLQLAASMSAFLKERNIKVTSKDYTLEFLLPPGATAQDRKNLMDELEEFSETGVIQRPQERNDGVIVVSVNKMDLPALTELIGKQLPKGTKVERVNNNHVVWVIPGEMGPAEQEVWRSTAALARQGLNQIVHVTVTVKDGFTYVDIRSGQTAHQQAVRQLLSDEKPEEEKGVDLVAIEQTKKRLANPENEVERLRILAEFERTHVAGRGVSQDMLDKILDEFNVVMSPAHYAVGRNPDIASDKTILLYRIRNNETRIYRNSRGFIYFFYATQKTEDQKGIAYPRISLNNRIQGSTVFFRDTVYHYARKYESVRKGKLIGMDMSRLQPFDRVMPGRLLALENELLKIALFNKSLDQIANDLFSADYSFAFEYHMENQIREISGAPFNDALDRRKAVMFSLFDEDNPMFNLARTIEVAAVAVVSKDPQAWHTLFNLAQTDNPNGVFAWLKALLETKGAPAKKREEINKQVRERAAAYYERELTGRPPVRHNGFEKYEAPPAAKAPRQETKENPADETSSLNDVPPPQPILAFSERQPDPYEPVRERLRTLFENPESGIDEWILETESNGKDPYRDALKHIARELAGPDVPYYDRLMAELAPGYTRIEAEISKVMLQIDGLKHMTFEKYIEGLLGPKGAADGETFENVSAENETVPDFELFILKKGNYVNLKNESRKIDEKFMEEIKELAKTKYLVDQGKEDGRLLRRWSQSGDLRNIFRIKSSDNKWALYLRYFNGKLLIIAFENRSVTHDGDVLDGKFKPEMQRYSMDNVPVWDDLNSEVNSMGTISFEDNKTQNAAMRTDNAMAAADPYGGIDLNSANLGLQIRHNGRGTLLPLSREDLARLESIKGFVPVILDIEPASSLAILRSVSR